MSFFKAFGIQKATERDKQLIWHLIQAKNSGLSMNEYMERFRAWSALNQEDIPYPEGVSIPVIDPEDDPEVYEGDMYNAWVKGGGYNQQYPQEDMYEVGQGFPHSRYERDDDPAKQNLQNMLWKMFGIQKEDVESILPHGCSPKQYEVMWSHFKDTLIHKDNTFFPHDDDGNILESLPNSEGFHEIMEKPEDAMHNPNIREAWIDFMGAVGPWYARGLFGRVHQLPHEDSSDDATLKLGGLYLDGEITPAERYMSRYEPNPERYIRQTDYSAPNQWHSREDFEQGVPGQDHPNNKGHHSYASFDDEKSEHNQVHDNHWFGSHRYWGPYNKHWFEHGSDESGIYNGHKVTVDNGEEGYHPDIYAKYGGETAQALPFLHQDILDRHHMEDMQRIVHGPNPLKWEDHVYDEWAGEGTTAFHHPLDYKNKYWKNLAITPEHLQSPPPDRQPPDDTSNGENQMNKMLWKAFGFSAGRRLS